MEAIFGRPGRIRLRLSSLHGDLTPAFTYEKSAGVPSGRALGSKRMDSSINREYGAGVSEVQTATQRVAGKIKRRKVWRGLGSKRVVVSSHDMCDFMQQHAGQIPLIHRNPVCRVRIPSGPSADRDSPRA
jgi:hypothetical protein